MKLYIDGLFYKGSGIGRYYESLVKELAKRDIKIYTCVPEELKHDFEKDFCDVLSNIDPIFVDYKKFSPVGFVKQSFILKSLETKVNLFFYPHVNLPFYIPQNTITTIHDLIPLTQYFGKKYKGKVYSFLIKRAIKKSKAIITISNTVSSEIVRKFNIKEKKLKVVYEFIDDKFFNKNTPFKRLLDDDYILFIGNRKKHKNLSNLILAFDKIKDKVNIKLVIAGSKDRQKDDVDILVENLNLKKYIIEFISPSDEEILSLYKYAKLFVFPSLFEGFGLPPLEALALGCPVVASNIPVLREILGEDIACFNPYDVDDMANKIYKAITDDYYREHLLTLGKERLKIFDKDKIINEYSYLFQSIVGGNW
jgi:glycosyltransferase involved in cell wall biosynthesis